MIFNAAKELGQLSKLKVRPRVEDWRGGSFLGERSQNGDMFKGQKPYSDRFKPDLFAPVCWKDLQISASDTV